MLNNNNSNNPFCLSGLFLIGVLLLAFHSAAFAQTNIGYSLKTNTKRCVALRQGQTCYKKLQLEWQAPTSGNFCLHNLQTNSIVQCWQQQPQSSLKIEFESSTDTTYVLRQENSTDDLATLTVTVSWVYEPHNNKTDSDWRLF